MKPLRVVMLTQAYLPFIGGAERQLAAVAQRLPALGIEPIVITRRLDDSPTFALVEGVPVHRLIVGRSRVAASLRYTAKAVALMRKLRPDVVHAFELRSPATTAVAYSLLRATPIVAKVLRGGTLGDIAAMSKTPARLARLRFVLSRIDAFAVISAEIDAELAGMGVSASRRRIIPNGVDSERFRPLAEEEKKALKAGLGFGPGPVALFAGRLEQEKRIDRLVALWPRVRAQEPLAELAVIGTGRLMPALSKDLPAGVRLLGPQADVLPWYQAADCFVLPSESEGLSNALLEAMAMGLRCTATSVGAAPDVLADGLGTLIPVDDDDRLVAALLHDLAAARHPDAALAARQRQRIEQDFSIDETARRLAALYHRLAAAKKGLTT